MGERAGTASGGPVNLSAAADRLREAARWLVLTFGAVAAVVFAGISISRFGDLDANTERAEFWLAVAGAAAAVGGTLVALLTAMSLAAASTVTVADLTDRSTRKQRAIAAAMRMLQRDPALAPWENDISKLVDELAGAERDYQKQLRAWRDDQTINADRTSLDRAATRQGALQQVLSTALEAASYVRLQARFRTARWVLGGSLLVAAAGAATFVWVTGTESTEDIPLELVAATWAVPADRGEELSEALGNACLYDLSAVPVLVIDDEDDGQEQVVATIPTRVCEPVRLVVDAHELTRVATLD